MVLLIRPILTREITNKSIDLPAKDSVLVGHEDVCLPYFEPHGTCHLLDQADIVARLPIGVNTGFSLKAHTEKRLVFGVLDLASVPERFGGSKQSNVVR